MNAPARPSWFQTITRPGSRLFFTITTFVVFFAGIALGVSMPTFQLWFQIPAVLVLMIWFIIMSKRHSRPPSTKQ